MRIFSTLLIIRKLVVSNTKSIDLLLSLRIQKSEFPFFFLENYNKANFAEQYFVTPNIKVAVSRGGGVFFFNENFDTNNKTNGRKIEKLELSSAKS